MQRLIFWLLVPLVFLSLPHSILARARRAAKTHIDASSSLVLEGKSHGPERAFDGDLATAWLENSAGSGAGEWLEISFKAPQSIHSITVFGGQFDNVDVFRKNNHIRSAELILTTRKGEKTYSLSFPDRFEPLTLAIGLEVEKVRLTVNRIYAGSLYSDTGFAEIAFNMDARDTAVINKLEAWKTSAKGVQQRQAYQATLEEARAQVEKGDLAGLIPLQDAVRLGPAPARKTLSQLVEPGFVLAHLDPDPTALEILKALQRPEPVIALEQAAWIASDESVSRYIRRVASYLRACGELRRPLREKIPAWSTPGVEPGALMGKGEPLALAVSSEGAIYVADTGNNRIQRFGETGRPELATGTSPVIEESFLGQEVPYYVAGSRAGTSPGEFTQPLAITTIFSPSGEWIAVVDAARYLQILNLELKPVKQWKVPSDDVPLTPGLGINGPALVSFKGEVFCLWGEHAFVYNPEGTLLREFQLEEEARSAVVYHARLLVHGGGTTIRRYGLDGFRYGPFIEVDPTHMTEELDLAVGPDGFFYILTDEGTVFRYNRRGKLRASFKIFSQPPRLFRLAIGLDAIYVTVDDRIRAIPLQ